MRVLRTILIRFENYPRFHCPGIAEFRFEEARRSSHWVGFTEESMALKSMPIWLVRYPTSFSRRIARIDCEGWRRLQTDTRWGYQRVRRLSKSRGFQFIEEERPSGWKQCYKRNRFINSQKLSREIVKWLALYFGKGVLGGSGTFFVVPGVTLPSVLGDWLEGVVWICMHVLWKNHNSFASWLSTHNRHLLRKQISRGWRAKFHLEFTSFCFPFFSHCSAEAGLVNRIKTCMNPGRSLGTDKHNNLDFSFFKSESDYTGQYKSCNGV